MMKRNTDKQKTFISNRSFIELIDKLLFVLHILVFIFGLLSLVEITVDHNIKMSVEIVTLVLIYVIVSMQIFIKSFQRLMIKKELKNIWGTKDIIINGNTDNSFGDKTIIEFENKWNIFSHDIKFEIFDNDKRLNWKPIVFIMDTANDSIFVEVESIDNISQQHWYVEIDYKNKMASWSGKLPVDSSYGTWEWKEK